jgi:hypothetical protein
MAKPSTKYKSCQAFISSKNTDTYNTTRKGYIKAETITRQADIHSTTQITALNNVRATSQAPRAQKSISMTRGKETTHASTGQMEKIYLLGLEAEAAGLVGARGPCEANDGRLLPVLPAAYALHEPHHVGLLPPP